MNSLVILSLIGVICGGQAPTAAQHLPRSQSSVVKQPAKLKLLGPHMVGAPRPLGILGVQTIPSKNFKLKDFQSFLAGPGTTVSEFTGNRRAFITPTALVLYDSSGTFGWIGALYAYQISNMLSHFGVTVTRQGVENYKSGQLAAYGSSYYLGTSYANPLPAAFMADFISNKNPFCWMGYNLWEVAWSPDMSAWNASFTNNFGFQFGYLDGTGYPTVKYKNATLSKQQYSPIQGYTLITNTTIAAAIATSTNGTATVPYIVKGANLWYVADNPLEYVAYNRGDDRQLAFADILNDTTGFVPSTVMRAALRIEDVSAACDRASLRGIADTLYAKNIPYVVCVIPDYKDPLGVDNNGKPLEIQVQNNSRFTADLKYMVSKGAQLVMHGVSHQYSNIRNPYDGISGDDVEFFRVTTDANGNAVNVGPVPEDSTAWVTNRLVSGFAMFASAGLPKPTGWNSPHYYATPIDYQAFAKSFGYCMDRVLTFTTDTNGNLQYIIQYAPYVFIDQYGNRRIPETLGYYDPTGSNGRINNPSDMIGYAQQIQCVRGGWASCYYHWYEGTSALKALVDGIKGLGYTFVNPSATTN